MVSTRPPPSPANGRIPYPAAELLAPGDVGLAPSSTAGLVDSRRGSSPGEAVSPSAQPTGLKRLKSMRDRVRDRSRDRTKPVGRDRAGSVAVATLGQHHPDAKDSTERETSTQGLKNWWKTFSANRPATPSPPPYQPSFRHGTATTTTMSTRRVFGVPLQRALSYASMQISTSGPDGSLYVWGEVPIVVGRCGAYLKGKTDIEGIFRVSGSAKRMRDLQAIFDEGPTFGSGIEWGTSPFTPHDVATIFRRYLTHLPEPVIPFAFYDQFRSVAANEHLTTEMRIRDYKKLIRTLPTENKFLLLYTLDLLGIVDQQSDKNLMTAANLAVIFQPGLLNHPGHEMRPSESAVSKDVVEQLIKHQHQFVMSMSMKLSKRKHSVQARSGDNVIMAAAPRPATARPSPAPERSISVDSSLTYRTAPESPDASLSQTHLGIPEAIPEHDHPAPPATPSSDGGRPVAVRADTDFLVPSDSDEEAPPGGYYIVESTARTASPRLAAMTPTSGHTTNFSVQELISPARPPRSVKRGRPSLPNLPWQGDAVPAIDIMDASDSDDDAPPGGYVVYENKRPSPTRPSPTRSEGANLSRSQTARNALQSAEARTNSPKPSGGATGLLRRRTLPTKRVSDFTARMRRAVLDA